MCTRPLQRAVDRGGCRLQKLGHLGGAELHDVAQDQHGSLTDRKFLHGRHHGQPDALARDERRFRGRTSSRSRLEPPWHPHRRRGLSSGSTEPPRARPAGPGGTRFSSARRHASSRSGRARCATRRVPQRRIPAPPAQVGLLYQILGVMHRAQHSVAVRNQLGAKRRRRLHEVLLGRHGQAPIRHAVWIRPTVRTIGRGAAAMNRACTTYLN